MTFSYPYNGPLPIIFVTVEDILTGKKFYTQMLVDTGACHTGFPAKYAAIFGHDNHHKDVKSHESKTAGGLVKCYLHSIRVGLLDPKSQEPKSLIWQSKRGKISFIEGFDAGFGLIGMDVISEWNEFAVLPKDKGGEIRISIS